MRPLARVRTCHAQPTPPSTCGDRSWRAFTLLELMIVLVIMTVILAVAWPSLRRPFNRAGTLEAARQLAADVALARQTAIERGETIALRFETDGSRYRIEPAEPQCGDSQSDTADDGLGDLLASSDQSESNSDNVGQEDSTDSTTDSGMDSGSSSDQLPGNQPLPPMEPIEQQLPNGVVFVAPGTPMEQDSLDATASEDLQQGADQEEQQSPADADGQEATTLEKLAAADQQSEQENWSTAVLFYPTGRAESIQWRLKGPDDYWVTVTLRGMTGAVDIGRLEHPVRTGPNQTPGAEDGTSEPVQWTDKPLNAAPVDPSGNTP